MMRAWLVLMLLLCCPQVSAWAGESGDAGAMGDNAAPVVLPAASAVASQRAEGDAGFTAPVVVDAVSADDVIGIRHLWTFEHPLKEAYVTGFQEPDKIFLLELSNIDGAGSDIILETNVGIGVMRGVLGISTSMSNRYVEVACYKKHRDDCSAQAIVIYKASTSYLPFGNKKGENVRENILPKLMERPCLDVLFSDEKGTPFPMYSDISPNSRATPRRDIHIAYEETLNSSYLVQITFPPGGGKEYSAIRLITSTGYASEGFSLPVDPRMPDTFRVEIAFSYSWPKWYSKSASGPPLPNGKLGSLRQDGPPIIYEAKALRRGRWENILPRLINDPIVRLPIHTLAGPLPRETPE